MDLNQNTQNYDRDRLMERVNEHERILGNLELDVLLPIDGDSSKLRFQKIRMQRGEVQRIYSKDVVVSGGGSTSYYSSDNIYYNYSFGFYVSGANVVIKGGSVRHGTRDPVVVDGDTIAIAANDTWIYVDYIYGSTASIKSSTTEPKDAATAHRRILHKWDLSGGKAVLDTICHLGDISIPGAFA